MPYPYNPQTTFCERERSGESSSEADSQAKPNRRPSQQRTTRAAESLMSPEPAVSGSKGEDGPRQNPGKPRELLGLSQAAAAKSLQPQTGWRWRESRANPSLSAGSLLSREDTGNSARFRTIAARRGPVNGPFPATFGGISLDRRTGKDGLAIRELPAGDREAHDACSRRVTVGASASPAPALESWSFPPLT